MSRQSLMVTLTYSDGHNNKQSISKKLKTHGSTLEHPQGAANSITLEMLYSEWESLCRGLCEQIKIKK